GEVDELNANLGLARACADDPELDADLIRLQRDLFALGAQLADPSATVASRVAKALILDSDVVRLEQMIDKFEAELIPLRNFILARGTSCGASLHVARAVRRRAQR